jgi:membrane protease YdiL (CAAX protease family)
VRLRSRKSEPDEKTTGGSAPTPDGLTAGVTFLVGAAIAAFLFLANPDLQPFEAYHLINDAVLIGVPLLATLLFLKQDPSQFGLNKGDKRLGLRYAFFGWLIMVPFLIYAASQPSFQHYYGRTLGQPLATVGYAFSPYLRPRLHWQGFVYYEAIMAFYFFCWEFFFRGFLLFGLARAKFLGNWGAVILQTIPFTLLHWSLVPAASKPPLEIASAFFGGLILGALAVRTRSFLYGFLIHWAMAMTLDVIVIVSSLAR